MKYSLENNEVSFGGQVIITDWQKVKVASPENLQDKVRVKESVETEIRKQKEIIPTSITLLIQSLYSK